VQYLQIDDHKIIFADYSLPSASDREEALRSGMSLIDACSLTMIEHSLRPEISLRQNLQEIRQQHPLFQKTLELEVLVSGNATLVPITEYEEQSKEAFFQCVFSESEKSKFRVFSQVLPMVRSVLVSGARESICQAIEEEFRGAAITYDSTLSALIRHFAPISDNKHRFRVFIHCRFHFVDIFIFDGRNLTMLTSYEVGSAMDVAYFVLAAVKMQGLPLKDIPYYVIGDATMGAEVLEAMKNFTTHCKFTTLVDEFGDRPLTTHPAVSYDLAVRILD